MPLDNAAEQKLRLSQVQLGGGATSKRLEPCKLTKNSICHSLLPLLLLFATQCGNTHGIRNTRVQYTPSGAWVAAAVLVVKFLSLNLIAERIKLQEKVMAFAELWIPLNICAVRQAIVMKFWHYIHKIFRIAYAKGFTYIFIGN